MNRTKQILAGIALTSAMTLAALPVYAESGMSGPSGERSTPGAVTAPGGMDNPASMGTQPATPGTAPDAMGSGMTGTSKSGVDFGSVDTNKDGNISLGEYLKQGGTRDSFKQSDKNGDNKLESSELLAQ